MYLREFLNEEQLNCLYCDHICEIKCSSYASRQGQQYNHHTIFVCNHCKETFSTMITNDSINEHLFMYQTFSCKTIVVTIMKNNFLIKNTSSIEIETPQFEINFKNKEDLYNKLKTYLLFS